MTDDLRRNRAVWGGVFMNWVLITGWLMAGAGVAVPMHIILAALHWISARISFHEIEIE
jgi:hypothetical protein